jgi:hypothetical protein
METRVNKRVQDAVRAAAYKDRLSRKLQLATYQEQLKRLRAKHYHAIMAYRKGPQMVTDGDYVAVLKDVYKAYVEAWQMAREEYHQRVMIIRQSDDIIRGLLPPDEFDLSEVDTIQMESAVFEYARELRHNRRQIQHESARNPGNFLCVQVGPTFKDDHCWFHPSTVLYHREQIGQRICDLFPVSAAWGVMIDQVSLRQRWIEETLRDYLAQNSETLSLDEKIGVCADSQLKQQVEKQANK